MNEIFALLAGWLDVPHTDECLRLEKVDAGQGFPARCQCDYLVRMKLALEQKIRQEPNVAIAFVAGANIKAGANVMVDAATGRLVPARS